MSQPLNPTIGERYVNAASEICTWNGTVWVCVPGPVGPGLPPPITSTGYEHIIVTNGQTSIPLISAVTDTSLTTIYVNGIKQQFSVDYSFVTLSTITWLNSSFALEATDVFEIYKY